MTALDRLVEEIHQGCELGLLPSKWDELAQTALAESVGEWLPEREFKHRTGSSDKWCRKHFSECQQNGLARKQGRYREWHVHARLPSKGRNLEDIERDILTTHDAT